MFTDSHCHIFDEYYEDINKVIKDASLNQVKKFIVAADSLKSAYEVLDKANTYEPIYAAIGIHPENTSDDPKIIDKLINENKKNKKLIAVGEIGLDYYYGKETKDKQLELFDYQLSLAEKYNLPVIIHSREATLDTINMIKKHHVRGVMHCFSGSLEVAKELLSLGFYIGVGGVMTFKKAKIDEVIKEIPLDRIILETDSPYLTPEPYRKYQNEPKYIKTIAEYLATLKNIDISEVSKVTEANIKELFSI